MTMSMQQMTFTTSFGNSKAENQNLFLAFSLTDGNIAIACCCEKRSIKELSSVVILGLVYNRQSLKS